MFCFSNNRIAVGRRGGPLLFLWCIGVLVGLQWKMYRNNLSTPVSAVHKSSGQGKALEKQIIWVTGLHDPGRPSISYQENSSYVEILTKMGNVGNFVWQYGGWRLLGGNEQYDLKAIRFGQSVPDPRAPLVVFTANILTMISLGTRWPVSLRNVNQLTQQIQNHQGPFFLVGAGGKFTRPIDDLVERDFTPHQNTSMLFRILTKKGAQVSVRGESTSRLLLFDNAPHHILGCPSLMISEDMNLGVKLSAKTHALQNKADLRILFTFPSFAHPNFLRALLAWMMKFPNSFCVLQSKEDKQNVNFLRRLLANAGVEPTKFLEGRLRWYTTFEAWSKDAATPDMALGARIHGSMVPILSAVPTLVVTPDERVRELACAMELPNTPLEIFNNISKSGNFDDLPDPLTLLKQNPIDGPRFDRNRAEKAKAYIEMLNTVGIVASPHVRSLASKL